MYLDEDGNVCVGEWLLEPMVSAFELPWRWKKVGNLASKTDIQTEWMRVKAAQTLRMMGERHFGDMTQLHVDLDA